MAVDSVWLKGVREKNRAKFGMAGMGGLGAEGATVISDTLFDARGRQTAVELNRQAIEAELRIREAQASNPQTAAILALPEIEIPQGKPIPKSWLIGGAVAAAALIGLIVWRAR